MPRFTLLSHASVAFEVDAATPEEARQLWRQWRARKPERRLGRHAKVVLLADFPTVLDQDGRKYTPKRGESFETGESGSTS